MAVGERFLFPRILPEGTDLSVDAAISMWLGDDPHIQTMLGASYQDIGAGVSVSNGFVYYTIDVAYVAGGGNYSPPATSLPGGPTAIPVYLVQTVHTHAGWLGRSHRPIWADVDRYRQGLWGARG